MQTSGSLRLTDTSGDGGHSEWRARGRGLHSGSESGCQWHYRQKPEQYCPVTFLPVKDRTGPGLQTLDLVLSITVLLKGRASDRPSVRPPLPTCGPAAGCGTVGDVRASGSVANQARYQSPAVRTHARTRWRLGVLLRTAFVGTYFYRSASPYGNAALLGGPPERTRSWSSGPCSCRDSPLKRKRLAPIATTGTVNNPRPRNQYFQ
jgi:hypothetical protein